MATDRFLEEATDLTADDEYTFVQLADVQLGMMEQMVDVQWLLGLRTLVRVATLGFNDGKKLVPVPKVVSDNKSLSKKEVYEEQLKLEIQMSERAVQIINKMQPKPRFAIICGDLTHVYPSATGKTVPKYEQQVADFKRIWKQVDPEIKLVCLCGNHDVGDRPNETTIRNFQTRFGKDYFSFKVNNDKMVVINSQFYKNPTQCEDLAQAQDVWLEKELGLNEEGAVRHCAVFSHIPPCILDQHEPSAYFNLTAEVRERLFDIALKGGASHWFCGHYHRNAVTTVEKDGKKLEVVTTGAVGANINNDTAADLLGLSGMKEITSSENKSGFRIVSVTASGIKHKFLTIKELEEQIM